jgi:hypothetical protein
MGMSKWIILVATVFIVFVLAYSIPIAISNPTTTNIIIVAALAIIAVLGFMTFVNAGKKKLAEAQTISGKKFTPID